MAIMNYMIFYYQNLTRAAAEKVMASYRVLEGVFTPREAMAPDAPILHPPRLGEKPSNVMYGTHVEKGAVESAQAAAEVVVEAMAASGITASLRGGRWVRMAPHATTPPDVADEVAEILSGLKTI